MLLRNVLFFIVKDHSIWKDRACNSSIGSSKYTQNHIKTDVIANLRRKENNFNYTFLPDKTQPYVKVVDFAKRPLHFNIHRNWQACPEPKMGAL